MNLSKARKLDIGDSVYLNADLNDPSVSGFDMKHMIVLGREDSTDYANGNVYLYDIEEKSLATEEFWCCGGFWSCGNPLTAVMTDRKKPLDTWVTSALGCLSDVMQSIIDDHRVTPATLKRFGLAYNAYTKLRETL